MRKFAAFLLALMLLLPQSMTAFAFEEERQADVYARAVRTTDGVYPAQIDDDTATVTTDEDIIITVTDAPESAVKLMVVPIPKDETQAWAWITDCLEDVGTPVHLFDIYFEDQDGNRINANGAVVTIDCPHCSGTPKICSLTTGGTVRVLNDSARGSEVAFRTDGSTYYIIADKTPSQHPGDTDIPQTGDHSGIGLWSGLLLGSTLALWLLIFKRRRQDESANA